MQLGMAPPGTSVSALQQETFRMEQENATLSSHNKTLEEHVRQRRKLAQVKRAVAQARKQQAASAEVASTGAETSTAASDQLGTMPQLPSSSPSFSAAASAGAKEAQRHALLLLPFSSAGEPRAREENRDPNAGSAPVAAADAPVACSSAAAPRAPQCAAREAARMQVAREDLAAVSLTERGEEEGCAVATDEAGTADGQPAPAGTAPAAAASAPVARSCRKRKPPTLFTAGPASCKGDSDEAAAAGGSAGGSAAAAAAAVATPAAVHPVAEEPSPKASGGATALACAGIALAKGARAAATVMPTAAPDVPATHTASASAMEPDAKWFADSGTVGGAAISQALRRKMTPALADSDCWGSLVGVLRTLVQAEQAAAVSGDNADASSAGGNKGGAGKGKSKGKGKTKRTKQQQHAAAAAATGAAHQRKRVRFRAFDGNCVPMPGDRERGSLAAVEKVLALLLRARHEAADAIAHRPQNHRAVHWLVSALDEVAAGAGAAAEVRASAAFYANELRVAATTNGADGSAGAGSGSGSGSGSGYSLVCSSGSTAGRLLFAALRWHLRYLLNPQQPSITVGAPPPTYKPEPTVCIDPAQGEHYENGHDLAAMLSHALSVMYNAYPAGPFDVPLATLEQAMATLHYTDAHCFVRRLLSFPGLMRGGCVGGGGGGGGGSEAAVAASWAAVQELAAELGRLPAPLLREANAGHFVALGDLKAFARQLRDEAQSIEEVTAAAEEAVSELVARRTQIATIMCERAVYPDLVPFDNESSM